MCGVTQFGIKGKLAHRYVGPFKIVEKIGEVAYRLNLPPQLGHVHDVFHASMLKKYTSDHSHVLPYTNIVLQADITYDEQLAEILGREVRLFNHKETPMVKVHWEKHNEEEATLELESEMYEKYPYLF